MPIEGLTPGPANAAPLDFSVHTQPSFDVASWQVDHLRALNRRWLTDFSKRATST